MPGFHLVRAIASVVAACCLVSAPTSASGQKSAARITPEAALANLVARVEPVTPPLAVLMKQGGPVKADVTVGVDGAVEQVAVLEGWKPLHTAAVEALKQWRFKPFLLNGQPARVIATLEVTFQGRTDTERHSVDTFRKAHFECQSQLQAAPRGAKTREYCAEAVRLSKLMPPDELWQRGQALLSHGQSLFAAGQHAEALAQLNEGLATAVRAFGPEDADVASIYEMVALFHIAAREYARADELFATAVRTFEAAIKRLPRMAGNYIPRFQAVLKRYAQAKALMNDPAGARALMERAAALTLPRGAPPDDPPMERIVASVRVVGARAARIREADVRAIQQLAASERIWLIDATQPYEQKGTVWWTPKVYFAPDSDAAGLRRGRTFTAQTTLTALEEFSVDRKWTALSRPQNYVQVPVAGRDPSSATTNRDLDGPIFVFGERDAFTDEEMLGLVQYVRAAGAQGRAAMVRTEIQPWPIGDIMRLQDGQVMVRLLDRNSSSSRMQMVRLERSGPSWSVVQILVGGP